MQAQRKLEKFLSVEAINTGKGGALAAPPASCQPFSIIAALSRSIYYYILQTCKRRCGISYRLQDTVYTVQCRIFLTKTEDSYSKDI
jgi:hypothetical protein